MKRLILAVTFKCILLTIVVLSVGFFLSRKSIFIQSNQRTSGIFAALALLPDVSDVVQVQRVRESLFWILRDVTVCRPEICGVHRYESWFIRTDERTAKLGQSSDRVNGFLVRGLQNSGSNFFEVHHDDMGWNETVDYYRATSGALAFSTNWDHYFYIERGNTIEISKEGKTIEISLAPPIDFKSDQNKRDACDVDDNKNHSYKVTVDSLMVNGKLMKLKKSQRTVYHPAYEHGRCVGWNYPDFSRPMFDGMNTVYFNLPWNERVNVNLDHLDSTGVSVEEISGS